MRKRYNSYELYDNYGIGYTFKGEPFAFSVEDFERIRDICWHRDAKGYISGTIDGQLVRMHRFLMDPPKGMVIDHRNHCMTDNRRENLAVVTQAQNMHNMKPRKDNEVGVNGVTQTDAGTWHAEIRANGTTLNLGTYDHREEAIAIRKVAEMELYGEHSYVASMEKAEEYGYVEIPGIIPEFVCAYKDELSEAEIAAIAKINAAKRKDIRWRMEARKRMETEESMKPEKCLEVALKGRNVRFSGGRTYVKRQNADGTVTTTGPYISGYDEKGVFFSCLESDLAEYTKIQSQSGHSA